MKPRFNERADTYSQAAVVQRQLAAWLAEWLEPAETLAPLTALELGAGDGLFTRHLVERHRRVLALDSAPQMVARGAAALPHVQWRHGDAWELSAPAAERVYSASLLQWCGDPIRTLCRWRGLVEPGGRMLHGFYVAPTLPEWQAVIPGTAPLQWHTGDEWLAAFRSAGFHVLRHERRTHTARFASALELVRFFHRTGAATRRALGAGTLRRILAEYDRRFPHGDGGVLSTWTFFRAESTLGL